MHEKQLKELGLTDNEIRIYLLLLEKGMMNPSEISKKLGLHRGYIYDALERMQEKEVIGSLTKDSKKFFMAIDPQNLAELLRDKLERFEKIIPDLMKIANTGEEEIKIQLFKGKYIYKTVLNDILATLKRNQEVLLYGIEEDIIENLGEFMPIYMDRYFSKIIKLNIKERLITKFGGKTFTNAKTTKYRFLPKEIIGKASFHVYGNKVAIFLTGTPNHLILIENKEVADSYRNQFEILWEKAKS